MKRLVHYNGSMEREKDQEIISLNSTELDRILDEAPEKKPLDEPNVIDVTHLPLLQKESFGDPIPPPPEEEIIDERHMDSSFLNEIKHVVLVLDSLLGKLGEEDIRQFALSNDYNRYVSLLKKLQLDHVISPQSK